MTHDRSRIVEAMIELKARRDDGKAVHENLNEVARKHRVPLGELRKRAEASWGSPLETDRNRHADHFQFASDAGVIRSEARQLARAVYDANLPGVREFPWWQVNWEREIDSALEEANLSHPGLEPIAREAFLEEAEQFKRLIEQVRGKNA